MPNSSYEIIVVGGGIVGLATARALLEKYPGCSLAVLEKNRPSLSTKPEEIRASSIRVFITNPGR